MKRSLAFLKSLKNTPEWARYTAKDIPFARTANVDIPALKGIKMDPRMAEVFEDMWKTNEPDRLYKIVDALNSFYMNSMFFKPYPPRS